MSWTDLYDQSFAFQMADTRSSTLRIPLKKPRLIPALTDCLPNRSTSYLSQRVVYGRTATWEIATRLTSIENDDVSSGRRLSVIAPSQEVIHFAYNRIRKQFTLSRTMLDATFNFLSTLDFPEYKWQLFRYSLLCDALSGGSQLARTELASPQWVLGSQS